MVLVRTVSRVVPAMILLMAVPVLIDSTVDRVLIKSMAVPVQILLISPMRLRLLLSISLRASRQLAQKLINSTRLRTLWVVQAMMLLLVMLVPTPSMEATVMTR